MAIVGGGLCGVMLAYELSRARMNVILVDRDQPGVGASSASTAMLQYELDAPLLKLIDLYGTKAGMSVYRRYAQSLVEIRRAVRRLSDRCDLEERPSVFIAGASMNSSELRAESRARQAAGISCEWIDGNTLYKRFGIVGDSAIVSPGAFEIDPVRMLRALLHTAANRGVRVFGRTEVVATEPHRDGVLLTTRRGQAIRAKFAVFATGARSPEFSDYTVVRTRTTFAAVSQPIDPLKLWSERAMFWEANDPYFYARLTPDNRVLMGGNDLDYGRCASDEDLTLASMRLLSTLRLRVPQLRDVQVTMTWCGEIAESLDGLPIIDRAPGLSRVAYVLGQGGSGLTASWIASKVLAGIVLAEPDPDADLFRKSRFASDAARRTLLANPDLSGENSLHEHPSDRRDRAHQHGDRETPPATRRGEHHDV